MIDFKFLIYIAFGILPSLVWLLYYLSRDLHPEPKKMILKIFLWGTLSTLPVIFIQLGLKAILESTTIAPFLPIGTLAYNIIYWFFIIALSEEFFKYLVVKIKVINTKDLDEPLDIMLYMVVSALGFAALENIMYLFNVRYSTLSWDVVVQSTLALSLVRFVGATFLHTLCSAVIGFFWAFEVLKPKKDFYYTELGFLIAVALHGAFDLFIMKLPDVQYVILLIVMLLGFGIFTFFGFETLKKMKSVTILDKPKL